MSHTSVIQSVIKRDGSVVPFDVRKIRHAIEMAFRDEYKGEVSQETLNEIHQLAENVATKMQDSPSVEEIQDKVEELLMEAGYHAVAKSYILYRDKRRHARELKKVYTGSEHPSLHYKNKKGDLLPIDFEQVRHRIAQACSNFEPQCSYQEIFDEAVHHLYDGIREDELRLAIVLAARSKIEKEPDYQYVCADLLLQDIEQEVTLTFQEFVKKGIEVKRLAPELGKFDLNKLAKALVPARNKLFTYQAVQTLYDRYLLHDGGRRIESPQYFWMRIAMGLSLQEKDKDDRAIEFYNVLSQHLFVSGTPTLFNSGTLHPQLSSCYLQTMEDSLEGIFKIITDNARLSKWAGGLGNDWTPVRATGALIRGTNGTTQGVVPFLKINNDTIVAVNQGGKRKGVCCAYLETWHLDLEDFLELRKNTGDERRRTHDMNTANWIPDLFMKRVKQQGTWTLFNPGETADLHDLYGKAFEKRYLEYEKMAKEGKLKQHKTVLALDLWRKMISMLFETGHPWITFKDPSNIRSAQTHAGVVHSSNLCTEILLNTSTTETAVCNLGSINLPLHMKQGKLDDQLLAKTITTAIRMLDNVIDLNFYPTPEAKTANTRHRAVGLGLMGFQDALYIMNIPYDSQEAVDFADRSMELISYHAIFASSKLATERGKYSTYEGSKWSQGLLPIDTIDMLEKERGETVTMNRDHHLDWKPVREHIKAHGMRNCQTMAIAPTATIAQIAGVTQSIEPTFAHLFSKSNLSGEFITINRYLHRHLKDLGLWDQNMVDELKYYDGSVQNIPSIPDSIKRVYKTAFEIEPVWIIECASRRQKWIDMGQSLDLYIRDPNGRKLSEMYLLAWEKGLKTTYYLRAQSATQVEKSTLDVNAKGIQPRWMKSKSASSMIQVDRGPAACRIDDPTCESCQ